ncbi:ketopantoate reductase C-terminal domain-containing protein [Streptomyces sp. NPDC051742]|uniref:ketopantoate reductase C-terminal domain-containing protein n=1 Tax=unclassified Streptomyces TaxID=2593676 RepID=UPI00342C56BF
MWHKWVFISTVAAVTCLLRGTVGDVNAVPGGSAFATAVLAEAAAVSAVAGFPVPEDGRAVVASTVTTAGSPLTASLYRDVVDGRPTEVEHVSGDLVARARALPVATPLLDLTTLHLRVHRYRTQREVRTGFTRSGIAQAGEAGSFPPGPFGWRSDRGRIRADMLSAEQAVTCRELSV